MNKHHLEKRCSLPLLVATNFKMLAPLDWMLGYMLATLALQPQHNLLGGLGLLVEHWFGLTTVTGLFPVVTTLPLCSQTILALLILCDLVQSVFPALLALAVGLLGLRYVHHGCG